MTEPDAVFWTMIGTIVTGAATVALAALSFATARVWKNGLAQQRVDEAHIALEECGAQIGKVVNSKQRNLTPPQHWSNLDEAWNKWSRFKSAHAVVRRYRPAIAALGDDGENILIRLGDFCHEAGCGNPATGKTLNGDFGKLKAALVRQMG